MIGGLFGKVSNGPWMTTLHRKEHASINNLDSCHHLALGSPKLESL